MLTALGVVYGDIGTSPLYAMREALHPARMPIDERSVLGVLSLICWSLLLVISTKYLALVLRADDHGEGGVLALMSLVPTKPGGWDRRVVLVLGLLGGALLYGDGAITPAISVLGAVEGLEVAAPGLERYVVPLALAILVGLFAIQRRGTLRVGALFGPVTLVWMLVIAALGVAAIARAPRVLLAVDPRHALGFLLASGWHGFAVLGGVFLVVTGGEALYADLGHFGRRPIRWAWYGLVLPALLLNYFGQGALLLRDPSAIKNPFYLLAPGWALYPLVLLATAATVIASQAVISGAFSLSRQAVQLGYLPRLTIEHTSEDEIGQVYVPAVNWALLALTLGLVLGFERATNLAGAYGVAVTTTMVVTTCLLFLLSRRSWGWSTTRAVAVLGPFLLIDLGFFAANMGKIPDGGWVPLLVGALVYLLFTTWERGRALLGTRLSERTTTLPELFERLRSDPPVRLAGRTAVFMSGRPDVAPTALIHHLRHDGALQERVILLNVTVDEVPRVARDDRIELRELGEGLIAVRAHFGYMESPTIARVFRYCRARDLELLPDEVTYYLGDVSFVPGEGPGLSAWRRRLFAFMARNEQRASLFYGIPPAQVVELGVQIEL
ncbi:MAG: potassium transporter Kup [Planctomycetota bacterium]